jgi:ATP-binding cassette subfamily B protein
MDTAAKMADIYETIQSFPKGYETDLGERGVNLSGGQKQRLAIARALAKNPAIYLFDDALAAVDTRTEERITENLTKAMSGHSAVLIAHRASVIMHADEILLLKTEKLLSAAPMSSFWRWMVNMPSFGARKATGTGGAAGMSARGMGLGRRRRPRAARSSILPS